MDSTIQSFSSSFYGKLTHRYQRSAYYVSIFVVDHYGIHERWDLTFPIRYRKASSEAEPLQLGLGTSLEVILHHISWPGVSIEGVIKLGGRR